MAVSKKQLAANRKNARKSTGPKTKAGKEIASRNSIKHGLYARSLLLNSPNVKENPTKYDTLLDSLSRDLQPRGAFEEFLVNKIANCIWRSQRAIMAESAHIVRQLDDVETNISRRSEGVGIIGGEGEDSLSPDDASRFGEYMLRMAAIPSIRAGERILRYSWRLDRELTRTFRMLGLLQKRRRSHSGNAKKRKL